MTAYKVSRPGRKRSEIVDADYFRVGERGELVFCNVNRDQQQGYPIFSSSATPQALGSNMWDRHEHHHEREQHTATLPRETTFTDYVGVLLLVAVLFAVLTLTMW